METKIGGLLKRMRLKTIIGVAGVSMSVGTLVKYIPDYGPLFTFVIGIILASYGLKGD